MERINRCLTILLPKRPYVDWLNRLPESGEKIWSLEDFHDEGFVYLIPDCSRLSDMRSYVHDNYLAVFEDALRRGCSDEDRWPSKRGREAFEAWFEVEIHSTILDMVKKPVEKKAY